MNLRKHILLASIACLLPSLANADPFDGFWSSGYRISGGGSIKLSTTMIGQDGRLETEFSNFAASGLQSADMRSNIWTDQQISC